MKGEEEVSSGRKGDTRLGWRFVRGISAGEEEKGGRGEAKDRVWDTQA